MLEELLDHVSVLDFSADLANELEWQSHVLEYDDSNLVAGSLEQLGQVIHWDN